MVRDLSIDAGKAILYGTPLSFVLLALVLAPHYALYHENALKALFEALGGWWFGPTLIAGIMVHELLHAVCWAVAGNLRLGEIHFGVHWRYVMPYVHPSMPIGVRAYALGSAAPGIVLGVVPALVGLASGSGAWSGWAAIFLAAATGDLMVLATLIGVPGESMVQDHPTRVGCQLVGGNDPAASDGRLQWARVEDQDGASSPTGGSSASTTAS